MLRGPIRPSTMLILAAMVLGISAPSTPCAAQARPNNVFVLTDDLDLSLVQFMPHVLEMERPGVSFANYFVTDSLCCPSRPSIFTGEFPHNSGVFRNLKPDGGFNAQFIVHSAGKPFFIEVATFAPHAPYVPTRRMRTPSRRCGRHAHPLLRPRPKRHAQMAEQIATPLQVGHRGNRPGLPQTRAIGARRGPDDR